MRRTHAMTRRTQTYFQALTLWLVSLCLAAGPALADAPGNGGDPSQGEEVCASGLYLMSFDQPQDNDTIPMAMVPFRNEYILGARLTLLMADAGQNTIRIVG